ncbi:MAG: pilus assembly protein [Rhizobiaceae bacterium]|nr:pilus assembly protein [Rhizobiaceae bacterium]
MFIATNRAKELWECRSGNFAMMTALAILPFIAMLGGAVDVSRAVHARAVLQKATEAAALSAASLTNDDDIQTIVEDYVAANLPEGDIWDTLQISILTSDVEHAAREIAIQTSVNVDSTFLHMAGVNDMVITTQSTALQKATKLEIAMVLDISSSMRGTKLVNLKAAATDFVDEVKQNNDHGVDVVSFNLIPYGGTVNVGSVFNDYVLPWDTPDLEIDASETYHLGAGVLDGKFRFTDGLECLEHPYEDYNDA